MSPRARRRRRAGAARPALALAALVAAAAAAAAPAAPAPPPRPGAPAAATPPPRLAAPAAILVEGSSGQAVFARHPHRRRAIASTTKLMTVLLALESRPLRATIVAPPYAADPVETKIGLRAGERMTVADLVRAVLLPSANDAANALAVGLAGSRAAFVRRMNRRARALGLHDTHYATPVGLDTPGNYSSAADLARLARAVRTHPFAAATMDRPRAVLRSGDHRRVIVNRNDLVGRVSWVNGVKTGHTLHAGYVLVGSGTRHGLTFVSVVLGDPAEGARDADTLALLRWGFATFRWATPVRRGAVLARARVRYADGRVDLVAARGVRRLVRGGQRVRVAVAAPHQLEGPLPRRAVVGHATVRVGGRPVARVDLVTARAVPQVSVATRAVRALGGPGTLVAIIAGAGAMVAALAWWRATLRRRRTRGPDMEAA